MKFPRLLALAALMSLSCLGAGQALAQDYPSRAVRVIVPYGTGGGSDILARQIGARLQAMWGQGVAVDNRAGASGNIGTEAVVHAPPDGYTLLLQNSTMVVNPAVNGKLNYDPEKDLTPIMLLGLTPIALVSHQSTNITNLKELVAYSKANPTGLSYGSCGVGTPQHFVMELVKQKSGVAATNVGYKGCAPALTDVVGGQVQLAILSANLAAPHLKTGKLNAIGVSTATRYQLMPQVPTFEEQGLKPLDFSIWYALMGPAKMKPEVVAKIYTDVQKVLAEPAVRENLSGAGVEPLSGNGAALSKLIKTDLARYAQLAKSANIKAE
ncbi:tripartite tricarboxylate transporter substrate binding protein [Polaromonas sp. JS666]|uniref:Bug family tripartite tricarboxylate transporter substrate binding protein n=1 Tax=Polaromonas sp. (strain JS666 / ATCC BAA-500) TaxID=296591 RepID=UPI00087F9CF0|nr:tripartite tricarboxylate transporter substrate binding protein [Polaromonas sp. JS666]SDN28230.1 Tripartite-type tricarboxylate transporter, receptor component TctC [Polaromonas sp. JS666]